MIFIAKYFVCKCCQKMLEVDYSNCGYVVDLLDYKSYLRDIKKFGQTDLDPNHYYEYEIGLCYDCYTTTVQKNNIAIEERTHQLISKFQEKEQELSNAIMTMLPSTTITLASNLCMENVHTLLGEKLNTILADKHLQAEKKDRQLKTIIREHSNKIEKYLTRQALKDSKIVQMIDDYNKASKEEKDELSHLVDKNSDYFYGKQTRTPTDGVDARELQKHVNHPHNFPPEELFYFEGTFSKSPSYRFDSLSNMCDINMSKISVIILNKIQEN
jgi:hypothetical protein